MKRSSKLYERGFRAQSSGMIAPGHEKWSGRWSAFVEDPRENLTLPLDIRGTDFQRRVWEAVSEIPFGRTTTFAEIGRVIGAPKAVRAVGNACSRNPLEFAIPCHRVLRGDGSYSGGSEWGDRRQETIVQRETASASKSQSKRPL